MFDLPQNATCDRKFRPCEITAVYADLFIRGSVFCKLRLRDVGRYCSIDMENMIGISHVLANDMLGAIIIDCN